MAEGVVYVGSNDGHLYAFDCATGALKWKFRTGGEVHGSPVIADGVVYIASDDGHLYSVQ